MSTQISHFNIYVKDLNEALRFYTEALGFVIRADFTNGGYRWLTVSPEDQPDIEMVLTEVKAGGVFDEEAVRVFTRLLDEGKLGGGAFRTDDMDGLYNDLTARGVEFLIAPRKQPYGIEAVFKDNSGNSFSVLQPKTAAEQTPG